MNTSLFEILRLRSEWEEIVGNLQWDDPNGTIDNLRTFKEKGYTNNRFRAGFDRAIEITENILEYYNGRSRQF
jgi:hypothetical protein